MSAEALLLVVVFIACLLMNVPVAFAIGGATLVAITAIGGIDAPPQVAWKFAEGIERFSLLAIPFFILAGQLMGAGGMATRLMNFASSLLGGTRGGLAYVNTLTCMLFGSISGSAAAAISSIGGFMVPEMRRRGDSKEFAAAFTTGAATTGLLIPPSNIMIVYAVVADGTSVAAIFLAGVLPGVLVGLLLMGVCFALSFRSSGSGEATGFSGMRAVGRDFLLAVPSLMLVVIVLGGILGGVFSATEAAAIAVLYAFLVPGVHWILEVLLRRGRQNDSADKSLTAEAWHRSTAWVGQMPNLLLQAGKINAVVMLLIGASQAMGWFLNYAQLPQQISEAMLSLSEHPVLILLLINLLLLAVGTFLDMTPAVLIFTPIFLPVVVELGVDPVHFGIVMIANLCIGLCTPPVGTCLFLGCGIGDTTIAKLTRMMLPFYAAMVLALLLITFVPKLSLTLPGWFGVL